MMMFDIINGGDLCHLTGVIVILLLLGRLLADERQKAWGTVLAVLAFLVFAVLSPTDAEDLFAIALRLRNCKH
jgi:hypothetical protein